MNKFKIETIDKKSEFYPKLLKYISEPPEKLYCIGNLGLLQEVGIAVVGSRKASGYGLWAAKAVGKTLSENNIVTVSGMATGIDSYAHLGALEGKKGTIAVLGNGVDMCFPAGNRNLRDKIAEKHLIISEYPEGYPGSKFTFPMRNRIISGMCMATVIVEAGLKSGALITAELAAEQGRVVMAIPGNINNIYSIGCNKLIQDGAYPLAVIDDIFSYLGIESSIDGESAKKFNELGEEEKNIIKMLMKHGEQTMEELSIKTNIRPQVVSGIVTVLEMKGIVSTAMGKIFIAKLTK